VPSRSQLVTALDSGDSYERVAQRFGIPPGQAYLIVTGLPADGSDVLGPEWLAAKEPYLLDGGSQHLANPPTEVPTEDESVLNWIKQRAGADEPMQQAARQRSAAPPEIAGDSDDVLDVLGYDHNQVKYLQEQLQTIPPDTPQHRQQRAAIVDMIRARLSRHEAAEERHFWPAVRDGVPNGAELAEQAQQQEQEGKDLLHALESVPPDDDKFDELVEQLNDALRKHVAFEDGVFLEARSHLSASRRKQLGRKIRKAEDKAESTAEDEA